jgi:hypothetical protein
MIQPTDFAAARASTVVTVASAQSRSNAWIETAHAVSIVGDVGVDARRLKVEQHVARVLMHLSVEHDAAS